ncbi:Putative transport protein YdiK [Buchnera aphidicola (Periphyllus testudinaceus)]|uniref:AI-2E family transporter YdiK n=1 Tax=Buchnera aphidicola TaxID=9 RepID=UPI00346404DB
MKNPKDSMDLSQIIVLTISISSIILASFYIICPFFKSLFWASMIVISTWPLMLKLEHFLGGRRHLSVFFIMIFLLLLFFIPVFLFINSLIENSILFINWIATEDHKIFNLNYLNSIPIFGSRFESGYNNLLNIKKNNIFHYFQPYIYQFIKFLIFQIKVLTKSLIDLFFVFFFSYLLYWKGESINSIIYDVSYRLNSKSIHEILLIIGKAIRSVALGVVVTAFFQGILAGLGLFIIGLPYSIFLIILIIFLSLIQIGSLPILIPIVFWLFWKKYFFYATFLLLWSFFLSILDNVLRCLFIKIGINLPSFLIISGVIGGFISFGMIGLFIGPVILDITYRIILSWMKEKSEKNVYNIKKIKKLIIKNK